VPAGSSLPDHELRLRAGERIEDGRLPLLVSTKVAAGYGTVNQCAVCDEPVTHEHTEYEVKDPRDGKLLMVHLRCYRAWQLECISRLPARPPVRITESADNEKGDLRDIG
jgi:hypothetical protein